MMFKVGDQIRLSRRANTRYGTVTAVRDGGQTVFGAFDDGMRFIRGEENLTDLVLLIPLRKIVFV
ncbi:hypothetical protein [Saccharopolyspora hattusasensis]|uniref:hypothetical protein n=1 Tax=Saccharopolyspora hattusasensis TaxID=1128679 RepID=UPI003D9978A0